jgi:hypothetical protein
MDLLNQIAIERECGRLPLLFAKHADDGDHAALAALFIEDCELARPFQPDHAYFGRDRVQALFRDRPPLLVRHLVTNVLVDVVSETEARGTNYLAMLSNHTSTQLPQEAGALYVAEFSDHYVKTADGWQFKSRHGRVSLHLGGSMPTIPAPTDEARGLK